jgi:hypothetical protein
MSLLEQFLTEECTPYVCRLLLDALQDARAGLAPRRKRLEFNRFEILFDLDEGDVTIEDVLEATNLGVQRVSVTEFSRALRARE